jgi:nitrate/nitrite-specific signal transduction histidine kinase
MTLKLLRIFTIVGPAIFVGLFELVRHYIFVEENPMLVGNLILLAAFTIVAFFFSRYIFGVIEKTQRDNVRRNEELKALNSVALDINKSLSLAAVLHKALSRVIQTTRADGGEILLLDDKGKLVERLVSSEFLLEMVQDENSLSFEEDTLANLATVQKGFLLSDLSHDARLSESSLAQNGVRSLAVVPLIHENNTLGVVLVISLNSGQFNGNDLWLLNNMGYQISMAIENARLHEQVREIGIMEERERIAREMHDGIAQVLSYVGTKSQAARQLISTGQVENAKSQLLQLEDVTDDLYGDVREAILGLRSTISLEKNMMSNLKEYISRFGHMSNVKTDLEIRDNSVLSLPSSFQTQIIYIIQEALSNIRKHAKASHAHVQISTRDGQMEVTVSDDGTGFDPSHGKQDGWPRFGLQTMKERANSIGGTLDISSIVGEGTKVVLTVPMKQEM